MENFNTEVNIGDEFYYQNKHKAVVVDIIKHWSTLTNGWTGHVTHMAKLVNGLSTNTFDVAKATIVRNRIIKK